MTAYYNEIDEKAAAWLRELIRRNLIAPGDVDTRSISDVRPDDLRGYTQCHFFAGIGVWSYALRCAGWPDDRPVWTGSCPCQPFSAAGKGAGFADERHLWPHFHWLIEQCGPSVVLGEQVASKDGLNWLDLVQADLEGTGYAVGAVDTCAAGFGAPHIRQRLYWVAEGLDHAASSRHVGPVAEPKREARDETWLRLSGSGSGFGRLGHDDDEGLEGQRRGYQTESGRLGSVRPVAAASEFSGLALADHADHAERRPDLSGRNDGFGQNAGRAQGPSNIGTSRANGGMAHDDDDRREAGLWGRPVRPERDTEHGNGLVGMADAAEFGRIGRRPSSSSDEPGEIERSARLRAASAGSAATGPTNGFWRAADWLFCRDGKWRPVEPGTFPLAHGAAARVGRLRGYGNAINAAQAQGFIEAFLEVEAERRLQLSEVSDIATDTVTQDVFT